MMGLGVENDIDELEEDHSQQLTAEKFTELHCVSQQNVVEEEEATVKQQSFGAITEILKAWEAAALQKAAQTITDPPPCLRLKNTEIPCANYASTMPSRLNHPDFTFFHR
ncbi:hypothetical protein AVEN_227931-1 [Araneus ventricosus]|uniref:Uncharacterized protein n=1 Tax=Araneus ventricosus TaxID=182803 RepID=A0A4Y2MWT8_ARAVE|nr:hypothetical protein AVEN_236680-1 [Araneus ventricosus]GBN31162.1 hypothetical protein AVEN_227931-1 [Araneus ventricosus]